MHASQGKLAGREHLRTRTHPIFCRLVVKAEQRLYKIDH